jgi:Ger(x)C family germination protein
MMKRITLFLLIILILLSVSGCNGSVELNQLAFVIGMGVDKVSAVDSWTPKKHEDDNYLVTVQVVRPAQLRNGATGESNADSAAFFNAQNEGPAIYTALQSVTNMFSRHLYMKQCEVLIVGRAVAEEDITPVLEYFFRNEEGRMTIPIFIATDTAEGILMEGTYLEHMPAVQLAGLSVNHKYTNKDNTVSVFEFTKDMLSEAIQPMVPILDTFVDSAGEIKATVSGLAVFNKNRMVGTLDDDEIFGIHLINGNLDNGVIRLSHFGGIVELMVSLAKTQRRIVYEDGKFSAFLSIDIESTVISTTKGRNTNDPKEIEDLKVHAGSELTGIIQKAINKAHAMNTDILGLGQLAYQMYPKEYAALPGKWEAAFVNVPITVDLKVNMITIGASREPLLQGMESTFDDENPELKENENLQSIENEDYQATDTENN